jgi:predicted phage terminase large subunit-like protein
MNYAPSWRGQAEHRLRLIRELKRRECRRSFLAFCIEALKPLGLSPAPHHRLLINELEQIARGENDRLLINMPPGSAKSTYASVLFPAWLLAQAPNLSVIGASHTADLAEAFSRRTMGMVREHAEMLGMDLAKESVANWETTNGGAYKSAGVGGPITGRRADCAIIDDPVKSREDADSERYRERAWAWFSADLRTRLRPCGRIVLIMTRWHEDDLGGRILLQQGDRWRVLKLPAIAGDDDPLGRAPGDWLWGDDDYGYASELRRVYDEYQANGAMRDWGALFQQDPRPADGGVFKTHLISVLDAAPAGNNVVRAWDLAATEQTGTRDPDWTAGVKMMRTQEGGFVVLDVVRFRGGPDDVERSIVNTAALDGHHCRIGIAQDPGQAGKQQVLYLTRKLSGYRVESSPETGDKSTRAAPVASQVNVGNVSMVKASWNAPFINELSSFPSGNKDDQIDALSRAFSMVGLRPPPIRIDPEFLRRV